MEPEGFGWAIHTRGGMQEQENHALTLLFPRSGTIWPPNKVSRFLLPEFYGSEKSYLFSKFDLSYLIKSLYLFNYNNIWCVESMKEKELA